jgi:hypothetical protein
MFLGEISLTNLIDAFYVCINDIFLHGSWAKEFINFLYYWIVDNEILHCGGNVRGLRLFVQGNVWT